MPPQAGLIHFSTHLSPPTQSRVVSFTQASQIVREQAELMALHAVLPSQTLPILDSLGRTLAKPIHADRDQPPFPRSTRDGFACRAADLNTGNKLKVLGQLRAGETWPTQLGSRTSLEADPGEISPGECVEIMTGAPVPAGCDCVVMLEHVDQGDGFVHLLRQNRGMETISTGANIVPAGAEARCGELILQSGTRISPSRIALAASFGIADVAVYARPRVAVIATGDELVELKQQPLPHQIRNSNSYSLAAQLLAIQAEPVLLGIARDDAGELEILIQKALEADLLLLSGGVSMGKYDLVEQVLLSMGAEFLFTGATIQPGKPVVFGKFATTSPPKYFFGLPGNPVSTLVTFSLFVEPLLGALGCPAVSRFAQAKLKHEFRGKAGLTRFLPAILESYPTRSPLESTVELVRWQGSGDIPAASRGNCLLLIPSESACLSSGETVTVLLL